MSDTIEQQRCPETTARMYSRAKIKRHLQEARYAFRRYAPPSIDDPGRMQPLYLVMSERGAVIRSMCYFFKDAKQLRYKNVTVGKSVVQKLYGRGLVEFYADSWESMREFARSQGS